MLRSIETYKLEIQNPVAMQICIEDIKTVEKEVICY